jgi:hypothetical protein
MIKMAILLIVGMAVGVGWASPSRAQFDQTKPAPRNLPPPSPDPRNLEGVWFKAATIDDPAARAKYGDSIQPPPLPPMSAEALALHDKRLAARMSGHPLLDPQVKCAPAGVPQMMFLPYPFQIIQTPGQVTIIHEHDRSNRIIHMDQPQPTRPPAPSWLGHSVGHWEGDTLVVDTIAQRPENLMYPHLPMTENTHVVERFKKIDGGRKLEDVYTIDDPKYYPTPWSGRMEFLWWPQDRVLEYVCEENDHPEDDAAAAYH